MRLEIHLTEFPLAEIHTTRFPIEKELTHYIIVPEDIMAIVPDRDRGTMKRRWYMNTTKHPYTFSEAQKAAKWASVHPDTLHKRGVRRFIKIQVLDRPEPTDTQIEKLLNGELDHKDKFRRGSQKRDDGDFGWIGAAHHTTTWNLSLERYLTEDRKPALAHHAGLGGNREGMFMEEYEDPFEAILAVTKKLTP